MLSQVPVHVAVAGIIAPTPSCHQVFAQRVHILVPFRECMEPHFLVGLTPVGLTLWNGQGIIPGGGK